MTFDFPFLLFLAPVVGFGAAAAAWLARRRRIRLARRWSPALARAARARGAWAPAVIGLAAALAVVGLAGPRAGRTRISTTTRALNVVFAVDISRSMLAEDAAPSRLQRTVRELRRLVQDLSGDRLGLVAFAGRSYILAPLTVDGGAIRMYLDALDPDIASEGGTDLGAALAQGRELLGAASDAADRVLVVFTDGESHDTLANAVTEAEALKAAGVRLVMVAEGLPTPTRIPIRDSTGGLVEYKRDTEGQVIQTQRRDDILRAVVDAAEGTLIPSESADQAGGIRDLLATMKRNPTVETQTADLVPRAWIPALIAALLLIGYTVMRPGPALIGLGGFLVFAAGRPAPAVAQRPSAGDRAMRKGNAARAAGAYLDEARRGSAADTALYNAGTAALDAGRLDIAQAALTKAARSLDPELRYRALYNLGLVDLRAADANKAEREQRLGDAVAHFREALRLQPASRRAKWNLEVADRRRPPPPAGGGGGAPPPSGGAKPQPPSRPPAPAGGLTRSQAEQILGSMERRERMTREEQQRRLSASTPPGGKDW